MWAGNYLPTIENEISTNNCLIKNASEEKHFADFVENNIEEDIFNFFELEPEFEIEFESLNEGIDYVLFNYYINSKKQPSFFVNTTVFFETIPLYDLFCNWKFHLA